MNCDKCPYKEFPKIPPSPIRQCDVAIVGLGPGCLLPKQEILSPNYIDIAKQPEKAINSNGEIQTVHKHFKRDYKGDVYTVKTCFGYELILTPEHQVLTLQVDLCGRSAHMRKWCLPTCWYNKRCINGCARYVQPIINWCQVKNLNPSMHWVVIPKITRDIKVTLIDFEKNAYHYHKKIGQIELTSNFGRLMGAYMANGYAYDGLHFCYSIHKKATVDMIINDIRAVFGDIKITLTRNKNTYVIQIFSRQIARWFKHNFGDYSKNKKIPECVMSASKTIIKEFIYGWYLGDGSNRKNSSCQHISTASKQASGQLIYLLLSLDIIPRYYKEKRKSTPLIKLQSWHSQIDYRVTWGNYDNSKIHDKLKFNNTKQQKTYYEDNAYFYLPIVSVSKSFYKGQVYNIETEDNTYAVPFIIHNSTEIAFKTPFIGPSGELLNDTLKLAGLPNREDIFITNALMCRLPEKEKLRKAAVLNCQQRLIDELTQVKPKMILALGNVAIHSITNNFKLKVTHINGSILSSPYFKDTKVIPIFHPSAVLRNPGNQPSFREAFTYAAYLLGGGKPKKPGKIYYTVVDDDKTLIETLKYLSDNYQGQILGADIETIGLSPYAGKTLYTGIAFESDIVVMFTWDKLHLPEVKEFFGNKNLLFGWQNGQFDTVFLHKLDVPAKIDHDSMILHYCMNEHEGYHDLDTLSMRELGADLYSWKMKSYITQMDKAPRHLWAPYLAKDCAYCKQLIDKFLPKVEGDRRLNSLYYRIMIPGANFLRKVQWNGFYVNKKYCLKYKNELEDEISVLNIELDTQFRAQWDPIQYRKDTHAKSLSVKFKPTSNKQLGWMIYDKLKLKPRILKETNDGKSVDKDVLNSLKGQHPAIDTLLTCRSKQKILSTYVDGVLEKVDSDSRIRSQFWLTRTTSGRLASRKPNMQNISRNRQVKNIFGAPKGRILIEADYKNLELRVLAHLSRDSFLTEVFKAGRDPHDEMAREIFGKGFTKEDRFKAKALNFGIAYGEGANAIAEDFDISINEARYLIKQWFVRAEGAKYFLDRCEEYLIARKTFVTHFGRKRRFGSVARYAKDPGMLAHMKRQARNFPIQSPASDLTFLASMEVDKIVADYQSMIVNLVHDSIVTETPNVKTVVMPFLNAMRNIMEEIPQREFNPEFPFPAEFSIGKSWGDMKEIEV